MKKILVSTLLVLLCTTLAFASKIEGKWKASMNTENGVMNLTYIFKVDGDSLSGSMFWSDYGDEFKFTDWKINGDEFTFNFYMDVTLVKCTGEVLSDDEIDIHWKVDSNEGVIKAKRIPSRN